MKNKIKIVMYLLLIFVLITTIFLEKFAQVFAVDSENSAFQFSSEMENIEENNDAEIFTKEVHTVFNRALCSSPRNQAWRTESAGKSHVGR